MQNTKILALKSSELVKPKTLPICDQIDKAIAAIATAALQIGDVWTVPTPIIFAVSHIFGSR
jgi:hypothetical protein